MLIGDVARRADVTPATIRYYEEIGLLTPPPRSAGGYRRYSQAALHEIDFIKKGQSLGFSLEEISEILQLSRAGTAPCSRVLELAERNLVAVDERMRHLRVFRDRLTSQIKKWRGKAIPNCNGLCEIINSVDLSTESSGKRQR